ncbi:ribonuclease III [Methanoculleus taiwanensis]|uniref:Ribonuclease III n=1 Tax=Methanoculleus taiwanensis TaxID=1550565 RepID=A0A498H207_9EURY|nr:ribonuclease III domain-containing protein [Methanoculleus taiwanensis]RXE57021.1 ribonuclease III [Methanoculleus taiwanensis]
MKFPTLPIRLKVPSFLRRHREEIPLPPAQGREEELRRLLAAPPFNLEIADAGELMLYDRALTHRSYVEGARYRRSATGDNERLEFLGNYVLDFVIADHLYSRYNLPPGELNRRLQVTGNANLAEIALSRNLGIDGALRRRGQVLTDAIIADAFEALLGAIYLDRGMETVRTVILAIFAEEIERFDLTRNYKGRLQELAASRKLGAVDYEYRQTGPENAATWTAQVLLGGEVCGTGTDSTKQGAATVAAEDALARLGEGRR